MSLCVFVCLLFIYQFIYGVSFRNYSSIQIHQIKKIIFSKINRIKIEFSWSVILSQKDPKQEKKHLK